MQRKIRTLSFSMALAACDDPSGLDRALEECGQTADENEAASCVDDVMEAEAQAQESEHELNLASEPEDPAYAVELEVEKADDNGPSGFKWHWHQTAIGNDYAWGRYTREGDYIAIQDRDNDGRRVAVHWKLSDGSRRGLCYTKVGTVWTPFGHRGPVQFCNKNFQEGNIKILFRVGTCDGDASPCNRVADYGQWSAWVSAET